MAEIVQEDKVISFRIWTNESTNRIMNADTKGNLLKMKSDKTRQA